MNRIFHADLLRVIAIVSVVTIHVTGELFYDIDRVSLDKWWASNLYMCLSQSGVPLFFMLSGMFLLKSEKSNNFSDVFYHRIPKIVIPLLFWSCFYSVYNTIYIKKVSIDIFKLIKSIYSGNVQDHLWFLYAILSLYLVTPIFKKYFALSSLKEQKIFILFLFIITSFIQPIESLIGIKNPLNVSFLSGYIIYYLMGYYLSNTRINKKNLLKAIIFILIVVKILLLYMARGNEKYFNLLISNTSVLSILTTAAVFALASSCDWNSIFERLNKTIFRCCFEIITSISQASYGIYLIHIIILGIISSRKSPLILNYNFIHPLIGIPITTIVALIVSYYAVRVIQQIPLVKKIVPS